MPVHRLREYGIDPSADAVLLLSELEELLFQAVVEVYGREFHSGIKAIPEEVWRSRAKIDGIDYAADLRALDHSLAKLGPERVLSRAGIEFLGLTFCSDAVRPLLEDMVPRAPRRGTRRGTVRVKIKYWPEDLAKIAVWNTVSQTYVELQCVDQVYAAGLSEHHHQQISNYAREQGLAFSSEEERCAARARLNQKIESFVTSRSIGDRRRAQRILARKQNVSVSTAVGGPPQPEDVTEPTLVMIETVANRRDGDQPPRNAVRKGRRRVPNRPATVPLSTRHTEPSTAQSIDDPFASFNRDELLEL